MPDYVYYCPDCKEYYEVYAPMGKARPEESCPECGKPGQRIYEMGSFTINKVYNPDRADYS